MAATLVNSVIAPIMHAFGTHHIRTTNDRKFAVVDVFVAMGVSNTTDAAGLKLRRLIADNEEVRSVVTRHIFPGQGQRDTFAASETGITRILMSLPGKRFEKYRKNAGEIMIRAFNGDRELASEIMEFEEKDTCGEMYTPLKDMDFSLAEEENNAAGVVYLAGSTDLTTFFKVGMWRGEHDDLLRRYKTYYGPRTWVRTWNTENIIDGEKNVLSHLSTFSIGGELIDIKAYETAVKFLNEHFDEVVDCDEDM